MDNNNGKILKNYSNYILYPDGQIYSIKNKKFLKPIKKNNGYFIVNLYNDYKRRKSLLIHRLIAIAFLENPNNYPEVNHKDENKSNNKVDNLEWCSREYNENYGEKKEKELKTKTKNSCKNGRKEIGQYDKEGNLIKTYESLSEASKLNGISIGNISSVLHGKRKHASGYFWRFI